MLHYFENLVTILARELFVARVPVIIVETDYPQKGIIHNMVYVQGKRRLPEKGRHRTLNRFCIEKTVIMHERRLIHVRAPKPAVALYAV